MAEKKLGLRKEDKNIWERRIAVTPDKIGILMKDHGIRTYVESFPGRAFTDEEFQNEGAVLLRSLQDCNVILGIKEVPIPLLMPGMTYMFFSHTIKGQSYNMPLLKAVLEKKITLIDYEKITDKAGRRKVYFGNYAGLAGMIDTLHILGLRLKHLGYRTPFLSIHAAYEYDDLADAKAELEKLAATIEKDGLGEYPHPLVFGFSGYGNVSTGAQTLFDILPHHDITVSDLGKTTASGASRLLKAVFREEDMVRTKDGTPFNLDIYYNQPEKYESRFQEILPHLDVLINAVYWEEQYPRLVERKWAMEQTDPRLKLITDISCDVNGSIEITEKSTESDNPAYVFSPVTGKIHDGVDGDGIVVLAVDNLPTELPRDASQTFSDKLFPYVPDIVNCDYRAAFEDLALPEEIHNAVITHNGHLTPRFSYLQKFLDKFDASATH